MIHVLENLKLRKLLSAYPAKAIEMLYQCHYQYFYDLALNLTKDPVAAADIVQEALIYVWENHKRLGQNHTQPIEHYLIRIIRNQATRYLRQQQKQSLLRISLNGHNKDSVENTVETNFINAEASGNLRVIISSFPSREKECLLMQLDQQLSIREIAEKLNISPKAVERNLTSARSRLRNRWLQRLQVTFK